MANPQPTRLPRLLDATIDDLAKGLRDGLFTSEDLMRTYMARILEVNADLKAVREINPRALFAARELDTARRQGILHGPLHGIPVLVKDNIWTHDGTQTTAGSFAMYGARSPREATVVRKLRKAGAIILGKTNMCQWSDWPCPKEPWRHDLKNVGWSATGGQTMAAYISDQSPSGSSGGSAVATSIGLATASLGTDTKGDIICPSEYNNIVGIKPTFGLTSAEWIIPFSTFHDTVGPMARTVKDAAYILSAIAGSDPDDLIPLDLPFATIPNYVGACRPWGLIGKRIGVPRDFINLYAEGDADCRISVQPSLLEFERALDVMRSVGATVIDSIPVTGFSFLAESMQMGRSSIHIDFKKDIEDHFKLLELNPQKLSSLVDLIIHTMNNSLEDHPDRNIGAWDLALYDFTCDPGLDGKRDQEHRKIGNAGMRRAMYNHELDALVLPSSISGRIPAIIGSPVITVPLGRMSEDTEMVTAPGGLVHIGPGRPIGIAFWGRKWSEEKLIEMAYSFEQFTKVRQQVLPLVVPTTELMHTFVPRGNGLLRS
ncbi:glutamyl-tRNA amidotransferase subunit A [Cercophora newfieldiana]|uniref:Glutamyl-tRNA amidotransferase subunit A n=1 Tax=Cercophora newfieldiana TaxID=92897 RepID=A0AA39YN93_9PEZI|nr:glutamyl-tRNA amidotransferase subunit A [Cercophora newfieldiana]